MSAMNDKSDQPGLEGQIKEKLIRSKQEWARDGRLLTGMSDEGHEKRLPPGQREVKNWPVLDLGQNLEPVLGSFATVADPQPQDVPFAIDGDADG